MPKSNNEIADNDKKIKKIKTIDKK